MADRSITILKGKNGLYTRIEHGETTVSNGDTITLSNFFATANPYSVTIIKKVDGSAMTCTYAAGTYAVTIIGAGTNIPCYYMAYGVKA